MMKMMMMNDNDMACGGLTFDLEWESNVDSTKHCNIFNFISPKGSKHKNKYND